MPRQPTERQPVTCSAAPLRIDSNNEAPEQLRTFLPGSLTGWEPSPDELQRHRVHFLGANWAVFAGDIRRAGGFDPRFGPGSPLNATGQEWNMQTALRNIGVEFVYLPEAIVWHHVEYERYNEDFLYRRKYRGGVELGIIWSDRMKTPRLRDRILHPWLRAQSRYFKNSIAAATAKLLGNRESHMRYKMEVEHARGMLFSLREARVATRH